MALTRATDKIIANVDGNLNLSGIVTASSFRGDGSQLTGIDASTLKNGSDTKAQANASGVVVTGVLTATSFRGDGSNLTNLPAGLGTALSSTQTSPLNKLYYTNEILSIGATVTVDHPATGTGAYTQYADIRLEEGADLIIEDGDDVIPDILGLGTDGGGLGAGGTGRIRVDSITNKNANGAPNFPNGLTGTAGTFTGSISAASGTITGNLGVGGVLTYEDVTNVDSVGVITARSGINLTGGSLTIPDSIIHSGDTNTKIRFPEADAVTIETNGSEKLRIKSDGKVNITTGGTLSGSHPPGDLNIVGTNFITMTPNDNTNASDNEVLGHIAFLPYGAGSIGAASAKIEAVAESGQSGSANPTSLRFYTKPSSAGPGNSGTERMRINQDGHVTKPNQPVFDVCGASGNPNASSGAVYITYTTVKVNNGNHYSTSTGKFTVPVAGLYFFSFGCIKSGNSNLARLHLYKNGSSANDRHLRMPTGGDGYGENGALTNIISCAVGDEIQVWLQEGVLHAGTAYLYFNGFLIG